MQRFEQYIDKSDKCWIWQGAKDRAGYGIFSFNKKTQYAHRVSLQIYNSHILTKGKHVAHLCHNTSCVRPDHLAEVTVKENAGHKRAHGTAQIGAKCHFAVLTWDNVNSIRESTDIPSNLAIQYNVKLQTIKRILCGRSWEK